MITKREFNKLKRLNREYYEQSKKLRNKFEKDLNLVGVTYDLQVVHDVHLSELFDTCTDNFTYDDLKRVYEGYSES